MNTDTKDASTMKPAAQRVAIAKACGWELKENPSHVWFYYLPGTFPMGATPYYELPDYLNDLNAMRVAEEVLIPDLWGNYEEILDCICAVGG